MKPFERYEEGENITTLTDIKTASEILVKKKNIVFLTGAGLSVASGIPTFRGDGGLWTKDTAHYKATDLATYKFFNEKS